MADTRGTRESDAARSEGPPLPISRRRRRLRITAAVLTIVGVLGATGGGIWYGVSRPTVYRPGEDIAEITHNLARDLPEGAPEVRFDDVTVAAGLQSFRFFAGPRSSQLPEDMGSGAAWGDFDNDGDDDLFLVSNGASLTTEPEGRAPCALFENMGDGSFRKVDEFPDLRIIGMGAAWGDCDGDGWLDLAVSAYNNLFLFRNRNGRMVRDEDFPDLPGCWTGVSWGDFNNDRSLDLYVCGYVQYKANSTDRSRASQRSSGGLVPFTLNPSSYEPERNLLFRNNGDGTFVEVAEELGVSNLQGRSLGALWCDLDQDGWLDLYVANDISDNVFFRNLGGTFVEMSHAAWVADYRGAMGLAVGDTDRDGDDEIFVTHWIAQENALYNSLFVDLCSALAEESDPSGESESGKPDDGRVPETLRFVDLASAQGLGQISLQMVGWGTEFADFDADGWLDLVVANGSTFETDDEPRQLKPQKSFLLWNRHGEFFHDLAPYADVFSTPHVSRGVALSDFDQDGDQDILFVHRDTGPQLLRNNMQTGNWIEFRLRSRNRDGDLTGFGDGATILVRIGDVLLRRTVSSTSYLSQSSHTIHFGLGAAEVIDHLEVRWLGGESDSWEGLAANALWQLSEGEATPQMIAAAAPPVRDAGSTEADEPLTERERVLKFWSIQRAAMRAMKVDGDLPAAMELFRKALALDPTHEDARYYLANCIAATGDRDSAIREFEELIRLSPRSHRALKGLGILLASHARSSDELRESLAMLERALAINPEETGVLLAMGEIAIMLGDVDQARTKLEWVCQTNPNSGKALFFRAYLAWRDGNQEDFGTLLRRAGETRRGEWKPEGTTAEGDVAVQMHVDASPLEQFWRTWDGLLEPAAAFTTLDEYLESGRWNGT